MAKADEPVETGAEDAAAVTAERKHDLDQLQKQIQIVGAVIAVVVSLATVSKSMVDWHASAMKDTREQIAAAEAYYIRAGERAVGMATGGNPAAPDLLQASFREVLDRRPVLIHAPAFSGDLAIEGQERVCAARELALAEHIATADAGTKVQFVAERQREQARTELKWNCDAMSRKAALAGSEQQQQLADAPQPSAPPSPAVTAAPVRISAQDAAKAAARPSVATRLNAVSPNTATGWQVDSYYCGAAAGSGAQAADKAGRLLAQKSDTHERVGGETIGLVRVSRTTQKVGGNWIVYDPGEKAFAEAVQALIASPGAAYELTPNRGPRTSWYLSLFSCPSAPAPAPSVGGATVLTPTRIAAETPPPRAPDPKRFQVDFKPFVFKASGLDDENQKAIDAAAGAAKAESARQVVVSSFDTSVGFTVQSRESARMRAEVVRSALVERGIDPALITVVTYDKDQLKGRPSSKRWVIIELRF